MHERDILANEKEKISFDREQRQLEMRMLDIQKQTELALKRVEKESEIALERETKIRQDMRELAKLETRNVLLEQQLREIKSKKKLWALRLWLSHRRPFRPNLQKTQLLLHRRRK